MKISSHGTRLKLESDVALPGRAIGSITKGAPAIVTLSLPTVLTSENLVRIGGTGWRSLDGRVFRVATADANLVMLADSDTTDEVGSAGAGFLYPLSFLDFCTASLNLAMPAGAVLDMTTIVDRDRTIRSGMPAIRSWDVQGFWDDIDAAQDRAWQLYRSGELAAYIAEFVDGSGMYFTASLHTLNVTAAIDQGVGITAGGAMSGAVGLLGVPPIFDWIIAGRPATPSPDWIIAGTPAAPSPYVIRPGSVGTFV